MTNSSIPLHRRQSPRTLAWFFTTLAATFMPSFLPVDSLEDSITYYLAAPALLAFALSLAGSYLASVIDDWRTLGSSQSPWPQLFLAVPLTIGLVLAHFKVLDIFSNIPQEALLVLGLPDHDYNWISWVVFFSAWALPPIMTFISPHPIGNVKTLAPSTQTSTLETHPTAYATSKIKGCQKVSSHIANVAGVAGVAICFILAIMTGAVAFAAKRAYKWSRSINRRPYR
ncbi:hypothetical protein [Kocuria rosea]|uniref:hypothetical protein n=1 Tax=Kocuria rosea TaxID=1275 RepID=UPI00203A4C8E|nr:hypothetical protein [Kocuria rosea]